MLCRIPLQHIESLPEDQKVSIIEIVKHRLIEDRRDLLVQNIKEAREEYSRSEARRGTVDDPDSTGLCGRCNPRMDTATRVFWSLLQN